MAVSHPAAVDASVAVKWLVKEELTDNALTLLYDAVAASAHIFVPPHFGGEVTNAVFQKLRSQDPTKHITEAEARRAIQELRQVFGDSIRTIDTSDLLEPALVFAHSHGLPSIYDSIYVNLARHLEVELWTADRRLMSIVGNAAP